MGPEIAETADAVALEKAYGVFQQEALQQKPDYQPESINTDGCEAIQKAWKSPFPSITLLLCFRHIMLRIQQRCHRQGTFFYCVSDKLWQLYHGLNRQQFAQRLRCLIKWA